ncbi:pseudouridine synthase [Polaribacter pacificus]|uniref:Pseudouridine synthase n=1 Tax=Polaribacter pacificus TaxID=1775173 RepID=A0A917MAM0_9FLAO|nr:23S rRNA pseudouridine(2604) synthase RluF [Polaribacter pacificus]GGG88295.1 pseudouridine synthase [Polaribacter pacificus]
MDRNSQTSINLNKYISSTGICSRREAEKLIVAGRVTINGNLTQLGNRVFPGDVVKIDGRPLQAKPPTLYLAFNKPVGIVCTTDLRERDNIIRYINHPERLFPIGRLDKPSEGLIFLTNDGDIVNKILRAGNNHEKDYVVTVDKPITDDFLQQMSNGIPILGTITKKCVLKKLASHSFQIVLTQGLNRQIRRMCEYLGYEVLSLKRTRIMNVHLDKLAIGDWRELTEQELSEINKMVASSSKTEEASKDNTVKTKKKTSTKKEAPKPNAFTKKSAAFRKNSPKNNRNSTSSNRKRKR